MKLRESVKTVSAALVISLASLTAAEAEEELVIGAAIAKTGWAAPYDSPVLDGFAVAMEEINAAGGLGGTYQIRLVVADNRSDNAQNAIITQDLIDQGVQLLIVSCDSSMVHATAQLIIDAQVPAISTCSSSPTLPVTGQGFVFANAVTDNVQGAAQASYAYDSGYRTAFLLQSPDIEYTRMPTYFAEAFETLGGEVVGEGTYALGQPDFSAEVTKIKQMDPAPDVIVTSAFEPDFPAFIRQLRGAGVMIPVIAGDGIDSPTTFAMGETVEGVVYTSSGFSEPGSPMADFEAKFEAMYDRPSETIMDPLGYDLAQIVDAAVTAAGTNDPVAVRDAMAELENVQGATGVISYKGGNGTPTRPVAIIKIVDGKRELVSRELPDPAIVPAPQL